VQLKKVVIRIYDEVNEDIVWRHFCYTPAQPYDEFKERFCQIKHITEYVRLWAEQDFGISLTDYTSLREIKEHIKERYKALFPKLHIEGSTDYQGWTRVWLAEKIEGALKHVQD